MTTTLQDDYRWVVHQRAVKAINQGLDAPPNAHEFYRHSLPGYVELLAERTPGHARESIMQALFDVEGIPLGIILLAFRATHREARAISDRPPVAPQPVDEIERLQSLSYAAYLRTPHWQAVRTDALGRARHRCQLCNRPDELEVYQRTYGRRGCERPADVIVLCAGCHGQHYERPAKSRSHER